MKPISHYAHIDLKHHQSVLKWPDPPATTGLNMTHRLNVSIIDEHRIAFCGDTAYDYPDDELKGRTHHEFRFCRVIVPELVRMLHEHLPTTVPSPLIQTVADYFGDIVRMLGASINVLSGPPLDSYYYGYESLNLDDKTLFNTPEDSEETNTSLPSLWESPNANAPFPVRIRPTEYRNPDEYEYVGLYRDCMDFEPILADMRQRWRKRNPKSL